MNKKIILSLLLAGCCFMPLSAQQIALKTNALYWATATMNIGAEVALSKHSTLSITANCNPWTIGADNRIQATFVQPEYRYWFSEKFTRAYVGVNLLGGKCEVGGFRVPLGLFSGLQSNYYKATAFAGGVSVGYQFYISPHWNLELMAGVGLAYVSYYRQPLSGPEVTNPVKTKRILPVPTEVGVSFVYLFNSRK